MGRRRPDVKHQWVYVHADMSTQFVIWKCRECGARVENRPELMSHRFERHEPTYREMYGFGVLFDCDMHKVKQVTES